MKQWVTMLIAAALLCFCLAAAGQAAGASQAGAGEAAPFLGEYSYTIEFSYGGLQYVLPGGRNAPLADILDALGLRGDVTAAEASAPDLFSVSDASGEWVVTAKQAFSTAETLRVAIGEAEYEIAVTDSDQETHVMVAYIDRNGTVCYMNGIKITSDHTDLTNNGSPLGGWYVVNEDVVVLKRLKAIGDIHLVLCEGVTMNATKGITVSEGSSLTIWAGTWTETPINGTGKLIATAYDQNAGIGGEATLNFSAAGTINICSGTVEATGSDGAAGIGGNLRPLMIGGMAGNSGGTVNIYGGTVTAHGGNEASGIGGGKDSTNSTVNIYGGTVNATGGNSGAGIGGGPKSKTITINITGGKVNAQGGNGAAGIGHANDCTINITGGAVTAAGGSGATGLGGASNSMVNITGGTVTATGGNDGSDARGIIGSVTLGQMRVGFLYHNGSVSWESAAKRQQRISDSLNFTLLISRCENHDYGNSPQGLCKYCGAVGGSVAYLDPAAPNANQTCADYTSLTGQTSLTSGWYVLRESGQIDARVEVSGDVNLILCDGAAWTITKGFHVASGNSLTIWAQSSSNDTAGRLTVTAPDSCVAGIGGNDWEACGRVTVNGGVLNINGGYKAAAIGGGRTGDGGTVTINGGYVAATGAQYGAGIGGGTAINDSYTAGSVGSVTITGGTVIATAGDSAAGIGSGAGISVNSGNPGDGTVIITGGTVKAIGNDGGEEEGGGAGIGGGRFSSGCTVRITGGDVTASSGNDFARSIGSGGSGRGVSSLSYDGMRAYLDINASSPVTADSRDWACSSPWVRLVYCMPHVGGTQGVCKYCGSPNLSCSYLDPTNADDPNQVCEENQFFAGQTSLTSGWYVANENAQIDTRIEISGNVNLIICDGVTLTAVQGFHVADGNSLTVWAQSDSSATAGRLNVTATESCLAGIGGNDWEACGTVTVNGGVLDINGGYKATAIGGGRTGAGGTVTINGGFVTARGAQYGNGIGGGTPINRNYFGGSVGRVTITGGTVTAIGGADASGIGGGGGTNTANGNPGEGTVTITGGKVTANGGTNGAGIGGGYYAAGCAVTITGGTVTATGGSGGAGIGGGVGAAGGAFTIMDGKVTACAGGNAQAIGCGADGGSEGSLAFADFISVFVSDAVEPVAVENRASACRGAWAKLMYSRVFYKYLDPPYAPSPTQICSKYSYYVGQTNLTTGWYVVMDSINVANRINVNGDVHILLRDGKELYAANGIHVSGENSLTVWAQSNGAGAGRLTVPKCEENACIGGNSREDGGRITINGGILDVTGYSGAGIGGGLYGAGGRITINGGTITARAGGSAACIGGGYGGGGGTIVYNGGIVTAMEPTSATIGAGYEGEGGTLTMNYTSGRDSFTACFYKAEVTFLKAFTGAGEYGGYVFDYRGYFTNDTLMGIPLVPMTTFSITNAEENKYGTAIPERNSEVAGAIVTLTFVPDDGWQFKSAYAEYLVEHYFVHRIQIEKYGNDWAFTMPDHDAVIHATFVPVSFGTPDFILPGGLTEIGEEAFQGIGAEIVKVPETCVSIGARAFKDAPNLIEIYIPANCTVEQGAFDGCPLVYVFGHRNSSAERYCNSADNCVFMEMKGN